MSRAVSRPATDRLDFAYRILSGDDSDERACQAIPDSACTDVPRNYLLNVANGSATKLAEQLASPGLVLPWLMATIGAPAALAGLLVPVKESGSLLPQLAVAARIRAIPRRKWIWAGAGATQAAVLVLIVLAAAGLPPLAAGLAIVVLFAAFSVASGVGSVAFQDVVGKTIPKGRRGRLLSNRAAIGGGLTLAAAAVMRYGLGDEARLEITLPLVLAAALLWLVGALAFAAMQEEATATGGGRSMLGELGEGLALFRGRPGYRRFIVVRSLLLSVELAMPFYALHAAALLGTSASELGLYVFAVGLANVVSSPLWGALSDRDSKTVLAWSGGLASLTGLGALGLALLPAPLQSAWLYAALFLVLGVAIAGVRLGRKTYLVDGAPAEERPLYVAFANTAVGALALTGGLVGLLADFTAPIVAIVLLAVLSGLGALAAGRLPKADDMARGDDGAGGAPGS